VTADTTPILDRQAPLPPRSAPGSGLGLLLSVWYGVIAIVAICIVLERPRRLREWIQFDFQEWFQAQRGSIGISGIVVSVLCAYYAMIAIHELGHVLAGLAVGFRLRSIRVGPLMLNRPFRASLYRGPGAFVNGVAELIPVPTERLTGRAMVMVLGGPTANILSAIVVLCFPFPGSAFCWAFAVFSVTNGLSDLFPFESRLGVSDGRRIWMLLRHRGRGERWLALLQLGGEINDGVLPESYSADALAKATAVVDDSADTVTAHAIAYAAAFHQHHDDEAGHFLEMCLAYSGRAAPVVREALMSDAAVFQARRRKRAVLAEQWLADMPTTSQFPWLRSKAEAAILEANGDVAGAVAKLAALETAILSFPRSAQRETSLQLLQRWKSEL